MRRALRGSRSTAAIVAAVLAACAAPFSVTSIGDDAGSDAATPNTGSGAVDAGAQSADGPNADAHTGDAADALAATACPPPDDPYWDAVFEPNGPPSGSSYYLYLGSMWEGGVCGVIEAGRVDHPATVNGELACALQAHNVPWEAGCPEAVCTSQSAYMGVPCSPGSPAIIGDAGECLVGGDASFFVGCGQAGRRPNGFDAPAASTYLARQAVLETASIVAFEELADELRSFGAPRALVDACLEAAREETEHARITTDLAVRFGAEVPPANASPSPRRTLDRCAIDNAVEGLVRETLAAAIALYQAKNAAESLRDDLALIARDEISHADLSRRIHAWAVEALDAEGRVAVASAMRDAIDDLARELAGKTPVDATMRAIGMPDAATARALHASLATSIWREELAALA